MLLYISKIYSFSLGSVLGTRVGTPLWIPTNFLDKCCHFWLFFDTFSQSFCISPEHPNSRSRPYQSRIPLSSNIFKWNSFNLTSSLYETGSLLIKFCNWGRLLGSWLLCRTMMKGCFWKDSHLFFKKNINPYQSASWHLALALKKDRIGSWFSEIQQRRYHVLFRPK